MSNRRYNIGLLTSQLEDDYANKVCRGVMEAAEEKDVNLFIFPGHYLDADYNDKERTQYEYQFNTLFSYPTRDNIDVLLIMLGTVCCAVDVEQKRKFLEQYYGIPVIIIGSEMNQFSSVIFDNHKGLIEEIEHMILEHHVSKIGFVSGPKTNQDALERLQVYKDVLTEHGIPVDENRIVYGNFSEYSTDVVAQLLDQNPDIEAIVFANDQMAIGGYKVMRERGIRVGVDVLVGGFDDAACCIKLIPNLTTVKADAVMLGYQAVIDGLELIQKPNQTIHSVIDSALVKRKSCGCRGFQYNDIMKYTTVDMEHTVEEEEIAGAVCDYVFYDFQDTDQFKQCREKLQKFFEYIIKLYVQDEISDYQQNMVIEYFTEDIYSSLREFVGLDRIFNAFDVLMHKMYNITKDSLRYFHFCNMISYLYRRITTESVSEEKKREEEIETLNYLINRITQDMLLFEYNDDAAYDTVVDKLTRLNMKSSYLFILQEPLEFHAAEKWVVPDNLELKVYHDGHKIYSVDSEEQLMSSENLLTNPFMPKDRRYTMVVSPLFTGYIHYGLLFSEVDYEYFHFLAPITDQLVSAIKIIRLLQEQEKTKEQLEVSLRQIRENNVLLDVVAKSDELTNVYNRRGFLGMASNIVHNQEYNGKSAIALYVDMDNLKIINDEFGHEDGDFALRLIASTLKESLDEGAVVARMGGDEFAVLKVLSDEEAASQNIVKRIRRRIDSLIQVKNEISDKPYLVNMSVGACQFICDKNVDISDILDKADKKLYEEKTTKVKVIYKEQKPK